jgi:predicted Zn-dependent protease
MGHWKMVISVAAADTSYRELKNSSLYLLSVNQLEAAEAAKGAEQQTLAKDAAASFKALLAATPDNPDAPNIMQSWSDALRMAGDSAAIPSIYADLMANPAKGTDVSLTMAGVIATRINKTDDAIKLFEGAVAKNPTSRDGLRNLAATYYGKEQFSKMFAPSTKLVAMDPNNYDAWMMFAYAAQGLAKGVKVPVEKKGVVMSAADRKVMDAAAAERKAWTDTLVKYQTIAEALPVKAEVTSFNRGAKDVTLTMQFEQQLATDGTYNVVVEFTDLAGAVVGTATQSVGPLKKGAPKAVTFKANAVNVAGYRYKPLK